MGTNRCFVGTNIWEYIILLTMARANNYPDNRDDFTFRIKKGFVDIDKKFQQHCIDKELNQSEEIRKLISEHIEKIEKEEGLIHVRKTSRLDEF